MYRVNEIFYSLQGEGRWTGRAAVFIRFCGCNLRCPFCDTEFQSHRLMSIDDILAAIRHYESRFVVITGGEPTLQVDDALVEALHREGYYIAMETNGTHQPPQGIDWVTVSPKDLFVDNATPIVTHANELKLVFDGVRPIPTYPIDADFRFLQPCDTGDEERNKTILSQCIDYIKHHPEWQLSLQTHKIVGIL